MEDLMKATNTHFPGLLIEDQPSSTPIVKDSQKEPFVIGVAGGTAAGKTTICNMIISQLCDHRVALLNQDLFYCVLNKEELKQAQDYNFDHPDDDVRLGRRIRRNKVQDRDIGSFLDKYYKFVKPAYDEFILPSKKYADIIVPRGGDNYVAINLIVQHIRMKLGEHDLCKIYPNLNVINSNFQIKGMSTLLHNNKSSKCDFVAYADQLIRLVVEHGLGHLSFTQKKAISSAGSLHAGVEFCEKVCCVSIICSGESMENSLRECCKGIKIGEIFIHGDGDKSKQLINENLPKDISNYHLLLLDPVLATGNSAVQAIQLLLEKGVQESNIIFLNLISAPGGIHTVCKKFPGLKIVTLEIDMALNEEFRGAPGIGELGGRKFGTEDGFQTTLNSTPNANGTAASF